MGRDVKALTYGTNEAENEENNDTPDHLRVYFLLQLGSLVARSTIVKHSLKIKQIFYLKHSNISYM